MAGFPALTDYKRNAIIECLTLGMNCKAIAKQEGVNYKTVVKLRDRVRDQHFAAAVASPVSEVSVQSSDTTTKAHTLGGTAADRKIVAQAAEISRLTKALKEAHTDHDMDAAVLGIIGGLKAANSNPPEWLTRPTRRGHGGVEVPVVSFADWHCSEVVNRSETNGINEYNLAVADRRIDRLVDTTISLCREHHAKNYPGIVVNLVGDFVSGALHPELAKSDELEILPTVLWVLDRLEAALIKLADHFGQVYVPCVPGNHGRNTLKPEFKRYAYKNFDWLIYKLLEQRIAANPAVCNAIKFQIDDSNMAFYKVFNKRFMLVHGDQMGVKGGDGIIGAIGPIMRGTIKVRGQQMTIGRDFDYLLLGHWHQMLWLPQAIVSNSLKGFDEYAQNSLRAVPSAPSQPLFFVHPKWGITSKWEVMVEEPIKPAATPWVSVFDKAA